MGVCINADTHIDIDLPTQPVEAKGEWSLVAASRSLSSPPEAPEIDAAAYSIISKGLK
ncbi:hypothetical protein N9B39_01925 [bacterium]|nr:hypothetical protein [bacterium]MDB4533057.1 hypothetical protein [bacterium]